MGSVRRLSLLIGAVSMLLLSGCGDANVTESVSDTKGSTSMSSQQEEGNTNALESVDSETVANEPDEKDESDELLCDRFCGKYSYKINSEEYYTLEITSFGNNLYAFGSEAMGDETSEMLEAYSFWAMELIPEDVMDLTSTEKDRCKAGILTFSIMSNMGKYWSAPSEGYISVSDEGVVFEDFDSNFPYGKEVLGKVFVRDERVEDMFPYLNEDRSVDLDGFEGLWREKDSDEPFYVEFSEGRNITIYQKISDKEVLLGRGSYSLDEGSFISARVNLLGNGDMPTELGAQIEHDAGTMTLQLHNELYESNVVFGERDSLELEKVDTADIPVVALSDVDVAEYNDVMIEPFYGVWTAALKDLEPLKEEKDILIEAGFDKARIVYAPEWENLTDEPYYCLTAGICSSSEEAKQLLNEVNAAGHSDAYVKYSGERVASKVLITVYNESTMEVLSDKVIFHDVQVNDTSYESNMEVTLVVDDKTIFDPTCDMFTFDNYTEGESPLLWIKDNYGKDEGRTTLLGIFEVSLSGNHVDKYFGCYWWD